MSVVVFLGPTLPRSEARLALDADYRPPAGHGDVLRAALERPRAIALVDGLFERAPSVWHKELLFALSEGIAVYGAASMGALRAAELDRFGMRGVGDVYRAYAEGRLEDDDEVAVAHADAEHGFRPTSDALVDVRATLEAATAAGVVSPAAAARVLGRLAATFYADRLLARALDPADREERRLLDWLPANRVQRKRADALELLGRLRDDLAGAPQPPPAGWTLQRTRLWEAARRRVEAGATLAPDAETADSALEGLLDEARLEPARWALLRDRHAPARADADAARSAWARQDALDQARAAHALARPEDVAAWLAAEGLDPADLDASTRRLAERRRQRVEAGAAVIATVATDGSLADLVARAAAKRAAVHAAEARDDDVEWWFRERLGRAVPPSLDAWAAEHGWRSGSELLRAIRRERAFLG